MTIFQPVTLCQATSWWWVSLRRGSLDDCGRSDLRPVGSLGRRITLVGRERFRMGIQSCRVMTAPGNQRGRSAWTNVTEGSPWRARGFPGKKLNASGVSGNPLVSLKRHVHQSLKVVETEGCPIAPRAGLVLERAGEGRREERSLLAAVLPDRRFDVAASQRVSWFFVVGSHLVSFFVEMKLALSQDEESQRTVHGGTRGRGRRWRAGEDQAAGVTVELARAVRLAGVSRSVTAGGCNKNIAGMRCGGGQNVHSENTTADIREPTPAFSGQTENEQDQSVTIKIQCKK
jgi:hypothetical protein